MLQRSCDRFSLISKRSKDSYLTETTAKLESVQTFEDLVMNIMSFEKIYTELFFLAFYTQFLFFVNQIAHRSALCVASSEIVLHQWQKTIKKFSSLVLIIVYEKNFSILNYSSNWISATVMKKTSTKLINWSSHLRYIFDITNKTVFNVIILTSYDIFVRRTLNMHKKTTKKNHHRKIFESKWSNVINSFLLDEKHKLRHKRIKIFVNIMQLNVEIIWFLTATSVINVSMIWIIFS
jgi:hypothetical protein